MTKKTLLIIILVHSFCKAQDVPVEKYDSFFKEPRTRVFVHLDKTAYLQREMLYYQAYLIDHHRNFLNTKVRNTVVEVYDQNGNRLVKQLKLANSGIVQGNFKIDSTFKSKQYFIKLRIKNDEQFPYERAHLSKFELLDRSVKKKNSQKGAMKVVPEGGKLIYGLENNISIRYLKPNQINKKFEAELYKNDQRIARIRSNRFGLARYKFKPEQGNDYQLKFKYLAEDIPEHSLNISDHGVIINANQLKDSYIFKISGKLKEISAESRLELMVHQEGKRFFISFNLQKKEFLRQVQVPKDKLFKGVNTVSVFKDGQLLSERLIMNKPDIYNKKDEIRVEQLPSNNEDSLHFKLNMPGIKDQFFVSSISVYPEKSISHYANANLASAIHLSPHLKDPVDHATYYFQEESNKIAYQLDMLLMNQNGSKYDWNDIFTGQHQFETDYEKGLKMKFKLKSRIRNKDQYLLVYPGPYQDDQLLNIKEDIFLDQQLRINNEVMRFSIVNERDKFRAPKFSLNNLYEFPEPSAPELSGIPPLNKNDFQLKDDQRKFVNSFKDAEQLEEVLIVEEKEEEEKGEFGNPFNQNFTKITRDVARSYMFVSDFLISRGLNVRENNGQISITIPRKRGNGEVLVLVDDTPISDPNLLYRTFLSEFKAISINKSGYGLGMRGQTGAIRLYTRNEPMEGFGGNSKWSKRRHTNSSTYIVEKGFAAPDAFKLSEYLSFDRASFEKVGTLGWIPAYDSRDNEKHFNIFDAGFKRIYISIQGITADGSIINRKVLKKITTD